MTNSHCSVGECAKPAKARGWCGMHYARWSKHGSVEIGRKPRARCSIADCDGLLEGRGYCNKHYQRFNKHGDPLKVIVDRTNTRRVTDCGYVLMKKPNHPNSQASGWVLEHVVVMSEQLGRPLLPFENVHHKNGIRTDNRPANLELWISSQPSGQRVEDQIAWAKWILETYGRAQ